MQTRGAMHWRAKDRRLCKRLHRQFNECYLLQFTVRCSHDFALVTCMERVNRFLIGVDLGSQRKAKRLPCFAMRTDNAGSKTSKRRISVLAFAIHSVYIIPGVM